MHRNANAKYACLFVLALAPHLSSQIGTLTICAWAMCLLVSMDWITG